MTTAVVRIRSAAEQALELVQREYPNYHPLISLVRLAHKSEVQEDPKLEFEVHKAILPYVTPKLSSVEVKQDIKEERRVIVSLFEPRQLDNGAIVDVQVPMITEVAEIVPLDAD